MLKVVGLIIGVLWFGFLCVSCVDMYRTNAATKAKFELCLAAAYGAIIAAMQMPYAIADNKWLAMVEAIIACVVGCLSATGARLVDKETREKAQREQEQREKEQREQEPLIRIGRRA